MITASLFLSALPALSPMPVPPPLSSGDFDAWRGYGASDWIDAHYPKEFRVGDMNGDGAPDVVVAQLFNTGKLSVLLNDGDGGFLPPFHVPQSKGSMGLALVDLDGDGDLDVVASNSGANWEGSGVTRFLNAGDGTLGSAQGFPSVSGPAGIAVADFDADGFADVAVAGYGFFGGGSQVAVHPGNGAGGFGAPTLLASGASPYRLAAGDLDGDGLVDLVVAREGKRVSVHRNVAGSLGAPLEYTTTGGTLAGDMFPGVALLDADGDGDLDVGYTSTRTLVGTDPSFGALAVLENIGSAKLGATTLHALPPYMGGASGLHVADVNGDGWSDVFTVHDPRGWAVELADGQGGFLPGTEIGAGQYPVAILTEDVDGDDLTDVLVLAHNSLEVTVHRNLGAGTFHLPDGPSVNPLSSDLDIADVDGDGDLDVAMAASYAGSGNVEVAYNDGDGGFTPGSFFGVGIGAMAVKLRDLDGDGHLDLLWADSDTSPPYDFWTALNDGSGSFGPATEWVANTCGNGDVEAFDMDGDGDLDVFLSEYLGCFGSGGGTRCYISENLGGGTFAPVVLYPLVLRPERIAHGDLDLDGDQDVVFTDAGGLSIGLNDGTGAFAPPIQIALSGGAKDVAAVDVDADGVLDLVTSSWSGGPGDGALVSILIGQGGATYAAPELHNGSYSPNLGNARDLVVADTDGDGDLDIATMNGGSNDVSVFTNLGDGTFTDQARYGTGPSPSAFGAGDMDGDGVLDIAVLIGTPPGLLDRRLIVLRGNGGGAAPTTPWSRSRIPSKAATSKGWQERR